MFYHISGISKQDAQEYFSIIFVELKPGHYTHDIVIFGPLNKKYPYSHMMHTLLESQ